MGEDSEVRRKRKRPRRSKNGGINSRGEATDEEG